MSVWLRPLMRGKEADVSNGRFTAWRTRFWRVAAAVFLCSGPVVFFFSWWPDVLHGLQVLWPFAEGDEGYGGFTVTLAIVYWMVYVRTLINTTSRKFFSAHPKGRQSFDGQADVGDLARLKNYCQRTDDTPTENQVNYFALSILAPRVIRRRVIDEFVPSRRTVTNTVTIEIDLDQRLVPWPTLASTQADGAGTSGMGSVSDTMRGDRVMAGSDLHMKADYIYVALSTPQKGALYDNLRVLDGNGHALPSLSHREYRLLAALTLRSLLKAAFGSGRLPDEALQAEHRGLSELIRFAPFEELAGESPDEYDARVDERIDELRDVVRAIADLRNHGGKPEYLELAAELVWLLSQSYAIVAVVPGPHNGNGSRFIARYERVLIPHLRLGRLLSGRGVKDRLRMFLGARPVFLTVNARNAGTCQSYHLQIVGPQELYVGDFNIDSIVAAAKARRPSVRDGDVADLRTPDHMPPYWRLRGRRGQHYFHLYTRALQPRRPNDLKVSVKFFEVPPGSLARAGVAAIATFIATLAVAFAVSKTSNLDTKIDGQVAVFLLAAPGIAAAWLGFEPRPGLLLDGTLAARLSTVATFVLSIAGSVVLLLNRAGVYPLYPAHLLTFITWDLTWTLIVIGAFANMIVTSYSWWQRSQYYQRVSVRSTDDSSVLTND